MGGLTLGVNTLYRVFCFFKLFIIGGKGLMLRACAIDVLVVRMCNSSTGMSMGLHTLLKMGSYSSTSMCQIWDNHLIY